MNNYIIGKQFKFEACHSLLRHRGKCSNLHGHSYRVDVKIYGELDIADSSEGMVVDFDLISELAKRIIEEPFDHSHIIWRDDAKMMAVAKQNPKMKVVIMDQRPTAENMARRFYDELDEAVRGHLLGRGYVHSVRVYETANAWAEYPYKKGEVAI